MLTVIWRRVKARSSGRREMWYLCRCHCGVVKWIVEHSVRRCVSCGCENRKRVLAGFRTTHGMRFFPEYNVWSKMKARCHSPNSTQFKWYGGRGITVCAEWRNSFEAFFSYMGKRPTPKHSIERKDNNKGYEPGNCIWTTVDVQMNNRRNTRRIVYNGETLTLSAVAKIIGISYKAAHHRVTRGTL